MSLITKQALTSQAVQYNVTVIHAEVSMSVPTARSVTFDVLAAVLLTHNDDIALTHRLEQDLNCDSLDRAEIAMELEESLGAEITNEMVERWQTVADVVATAERIAAPASRTLTEATR
jgi:acyl carrier protein